MSIRYAYAFCRFAAVACAMATVGGCMAGPTVTIVPPAGDCQTLSARSCDYTILGERLLQVRLHLQPQYGLGGGEQQYLVLRLPADRSGTFEVGEAIDQQHRVGGKLFVLRPGRPYSTVIVSGSISSRARGALAENLTAEKLYRGRFDLRCEDGTHLSGSFVAYPQDRPRSIFD